MRHHTVVLLTSAVVCVFLSGCSSGGSSPSTPPPGTTTGPTTLGWSSPNFFTDSTPLIPERDLQYFEVYVKQEPQHRPEDLPVAIVSPQVNILHLADISPPLSKGVKYYFFVRAKPVDGEASDFSEVRSFLIPQ